MLLGLFAKVVRKNVKPPMMVLVWWPISGLASALEDWEKT
jgi:hypothetical protein